jgi:hypothetical protein
LHDLVVAAAVRLFDVGVLVRSISMHRTSFAARSAAEERTRSASASTPWMETPMQSAGLSLSDS